MTPNRFFKYALDKFQRPSGGAQIDSSWVDTTTLVGSQGPIAGAIVNPSGVSVVDFPIPTGVRRLTLLSSQMRAPTNSMVRLGTSAGLLAEGYKSRAVFYGQSVGLEGETDAGLLVPKCGGVDGSFSMTFHRMDPNTWNAEGQGRDWFSASCASYGYMVLPGELTTLRYISAETMTSGSLQLLWEF